MQPRKNRPLIYGLLLGVWVLVIAWQIEEHLRVRESAQNALRKRSEAIANTLGAVVRGLQFRGAVFRDRLEPVLTELVGGDTNGVASGEVVSIALLNAAGAPVASAGRAIDLGQKDILQAGEHWGIRSMTRVYSVEGAFLKPEGDTNTPAPLILEPRTNSMRGSYRDYSRREYRTNLTDASNALENAASPALETNAATGQIEPRPRRPFWARNLDEQQYQELIASHELHGLVLTLSTESLQAVTAHDLWLRFTIIFFAGISALGAGLAWRNLSQTADLQIRLVRASELNSHLKEMNLAAAGLAHETRNPLNIIRGMAQMLSKQPETPADIRDKARAIVDETDKVTAQLNEFINYSRPREIRRARLALNTVVNEVVRTLNHDLEEKGIRVEIQGEPVAIEADEQLLRQVLFNLLINAVQAVTAGAKIQVITGAQGNNEAFLEIRDNGPGVPPERRQEIFKPYFTMQEKGTGLGLAVVQQIVLAHGWEIVCLPNEPQGAVFRITHLKLMA